VSIVPTIDATPIKALTRLGGADGWFMIDPFPNKTPSRYPDGGFHMEPSGIGRWREAFQVGKFLVKAVMTDK
jgi:hypothetical protein